MKTIFNKVTSTAAGAVALLVGCAMAGLGMTVIALLAMFALAVVGLAFLASPFVAYAAQNAEIKEFETPRDPTAAAG